MTSQRANWNREDGPPVRPPVPELMVEPEPKSPEEQAALKESFKELNRQFGSIRPRSLQPKSQRS